MAMSPINFRYTKEENRGKIYLQTHVTEGKKER